MVEPEDVADEATPVTASTVVPAEETKTSKKKKKHKKEDAALEKFRLEQQEVKAKEMSKIKHRKLQCEQDFQALRSYRKSIPGALLETINGADHSCYLLERFQEENNYMGKKCGHKRNLMTVKHLLTRIAKYADEPTKCLKEAQQVIKSTFPMVQGMPSGDKCTPEFAVRVLQGLQRGSHRLRPPGIRERAEHRAARCSKSGSHGPSYGMGNLHCRWNPHHN